MSKTPSSSSSGDIKVRGIWDFENTPLPDDHFGNSLREKIEEGLKLLEKLLAFGPTKGSTYEKIANIKKIKIRKYHIEDLHCAGCGDLAVSFSENKDKDRGKNRWIQVFCFVESKTNQN